MTANLNELLDGFTRVRGVSAVLLAGQDGLVLQSQMAPGAESIDLDILAAIASSGLVPASEIGREAGRGGLVQSIFEYDRGVVVMEPLGNTAVLVVLTEAAANLGLLRLQARRAHNELESALAGL